MNIEESIKDVITTKINEGLIEKLVAENLEKGINKSLENLLCSYGDVTNVIESKIKDVMIKQLSSFDYSKYVAKLDHVLIEILEHTSLDNKKILENFKSLMIDVEFPKVVKVSEIFEQYKQYVTENIDTEDLEICYDDEPSYEYVSVSMEIEYEDKRLWSRFKNAKIIFECEEDEKLNYEVYLSKFQEYPWALSFKTDTSIESLRYLDEFKIYLLKLSHSGSKIEIDENNLEDDVKPEATPEATFN